MDNQYNCEACSYTTNKKSNYLKHLKTKKHIRICGEDSIEHTKINSEQIKENDNSCIEPIKSKALLYAIMNIETKLSEIEESILRQSELISKIIDNQTMLNIMMIKKEN